MPRRPRNSLGQFLVATACLADSASLKEMHQHLHKIRDDMDDEYSLSLSSKDNASFSSGNLSDSDKEPNLTHLTLQSSSSDDDDEEEEDEGDTSFETATHDNLSMKVLIDDDSPSVAADNNPKTDDKKQNNNNNNARLVVVSPSPVKRDAPPLEEQRDDHDDDDDDTAELLDRHLLPPVNLSDIVETNQVCVSLPHGDGRPCHLELVEFTLKHEAWQISWTVKNGALGLLRYLCTVYQEKDWDNLTLMSVGAGNGLVGLGVAAASRGKVAVALADVPQAMPLLGQNIALNEAHWVGNDRVVADVVEWGKPISKGWIRKFLKRTESVKASYHQEQERTVVMAGADVLFHRSQLEPLLSTLCEMHVRVREFTNSELTTVECVLALESNIPCLDDLWTIARKNGFSVERMAIVNVNSQDRLHLDNATVHCLDMHRRQLPPVTQAKREEGVVWIIRIRKMPYTFAI